MKPKEREGVSSKRQRARSLKHIAPRDWAVVSQLRSSGCTLVGPSSVRALLQVVSLSLEVRCCDLFPVHSREKHCGIKRLVWAKAPETSQGGVVVMDWTRSRC